MKVPKTYSYIDTLIMDVINKRELADSRLDAPVIRDPSDPKRIRRNVAKVSKPSKAELIERHRSPFSKCTCIRRFLTIPIQETVACVSRK